MRQFTTVAVTERRILLHVLDMHRRARPRWVMIGVYQHCGEHHSHRHLAEFDFHYSNRIKLGVDHTERTRRAIKGAGGKRLTYRRTRAPSSLP